MSFKNLEKNFVRDLAALYPAEEAQNIWRLTIQTLTGTDPHSGGLRDQSFRPDPCYLKMLDKIKGRLLKAEPIQYILNEAWFYDIPFYVDKNVLIPRPETEELADWIIKDHQPATAISILDVGTGSGCIPVILKRKLPQAVVSACDVSPEALKVAQKNAATHKTDIRFMELDFLNEQGWHQLPNTDILVSNPPYIPETDKTGLHKNVLDHEPHLALFVPEQDPLLFYRKIAKAAGTLLNPNGQIYVEVHEYLAGETKLLFENSGFTATIKTDLQGKQRMIRSVKTTR